MAVGFDVWQFRFSETVKDSIDELWSIVAMCEERLAGWPYPCHTRTSWVLASDLRHRNEVL